MRVLRIDVDLYAPSLARIISTIEKEEYVYIKQDKGGVIEKKTTKLGARKKPKRLIFTENIEPICVYHEKDSTFSFFLDYLDFPYLEEYFKTLTLSEKEPFLLTEEKFLAQFEKNFLIWYVYNMKVNASISQGHRKSR